MTLGLLAGGATTGSAIGLVGALGAPVLPTNVRLALFGLAAIGLMVLELGVLTFPLPQRTRLIPQSVVHRGPAVGAFQFGFEMGTGMRTYITAASPYLVAIAAILSGSWMAGVALGVGFGIGRSIVVASTRRSVTAGAWWSSFDSVEGRNRVVMISLAMIAVVPALISAIA